MQNQLISAKQPILGADYPISDWPQAFRLERDLLAYIGLVPKHSSTGGEE